MQGVVFPETDAVIDFEDLFASIPSPYMVLDAKLNYVAVNRAYADVVRMPAEKLVGANLFELFPNDGEEGLRLQASLRSVLDTGRSDTIAFIPYAMPRGDGRVEQRYWTAVHTPLKAPDGTVAFVLQNTVDVTELYHAEHGVAEARVDETGGGMHVLQRAREAEQAYRGSLAQTDEFRRLFTQAPSMIALLDGPDHVFTFANEAYRSFTAHRSMIGRPVREVFPEAAERGLLHSLDLVLDTGRPQSGEGMRILVRSAADGEPREAFIDFHYQPIRNDKGAITGIFVQGADRTEQYRTLRRQRLLLDELNHRVKNTLSTVQSIARRSFKRVDDDGLLAFEARIKALSNVHDIISEGHWDKVGLEALIRQEFAAFGADRVTVAGDPIELAPRAAIAFAMLFHELASNSVKYGRLGDGGALAVRWHAQDEATTGRMLQVEWREDGERTVPAGWRRGTGLRTLARIVEGELGGSLALDLRTTGFICRFEIALDEVGRVGG